MKELTRRKILQSTVGVASIGSISGCAVISGKEPTEKQVFLENQTEQTQQVEVAIACMETSGSDDFEDTVRINPSKAVLLYTVTKEEFCISVHAWDLGESGVAGWANVYLSPDGNRPVQEDDEIISMRDPSQYSTIGYVISLRQTPLNENPHSTVEVKPIQEAPPSIQPG